MPKGTGNPSPLLFLCIDHILRLAVKETLDVSNYAVQQALACFQRCPCDMGRDDAIWRCEQRGIAGDGLSGYHIHRCATQLAAGQGVRNSLFVNQRATGGIDQDGSILHFRDGLRVDDALCFGEQGTMQSYHIGLGQQFLQGHMGFSGMLGAAVGQDLHAHCVGNFRHIFADPAVADDA